VKDIVGTGVYTSDSPICKAAIHAGIIYATVGGTIQMTLSYPQEKYFDSNNYEIDSISKT